MPLNAGLLKRYADEIDSMSISSLRKYIKSIKFVSEHKGALINRLKKHSINGLKQRIVKSRSMGKPNKKVNKALCYKLLSILTRNELTFLEKYAESRLSRLNMNKFIEELNEEIFCNEREVEKATKFVSKLSRNDG